MSDNDQTRIDQAMAELFKLRAAARAARRKASQQWGPLVQSFMQGMKFWEDEKAQGVSLPDRVSHLATILRASWPFQREWHYVCEQCGETGLVMAVCRKGARCNGISTRTDFAGQTPGKYKRLCWQHPDSDYEHDYGMPCWCEKGERFRVVAKAAESYATAGKSKSKPMSRIGR
jgi:hypothetical protein